MRQPYESSITARLSDFMKLGLTLYSDDEYTITLDSGSGKLIFATERYYHPSMTIMVIDLAGTARILELVKRVLDPELAESDKIELQSLNSKYDFRNSSVDQLTETGGFSAYINTPLAQTIVFLLKYCPVVFHLPTEKVLEYETESDALLRALNIRPSKI